MTKPNLNSPCPCGSGHAFAECCGPYLEGSQSPANCETLMRSRYTAHVLLHEAYLLASWHPSTRPLTLSLTDGVATRWLGLEVKRHEQQDADHASVEFVARYKVNGRAHRHHETSRFVLEDGRWFYVDGDLQPGRSKT